MKSNFMLIKNREVIRHFVKNKKRILKSYDLNIYFRGNQKVKLRTYGFGISKLALVSMNNNEVSLLDINEKLFKTNSDEEIVLDNYIIQKMYLENLDELNIIEETIINEKAKIRKNLRSVSGILCFSKNFMELMNEIKKEKKFFFNKNKLMLKTCDSSFYGCDFNDLEIIGVRLKKKELVKKNTIRNKVYRGIKNIENIVKEQKPNKVIILKDDYILKNRMFGTVKPKIIQKYKDYCIDGVVVIENGNLKVVDNVRLQKIKEENFVRYVLYGFIYVGTSNIKKTVKIERIDESSKKLLSYFV